MGEFLSEPIEDKNTTEGKYTSEYISKNLHLNIFKKINEIGEENIEEAIKDAFMQTDNVWKDESSNLCLIKMTLSSTMMRISKKDRRYEDYNVSRAFGDFKACKNNPGKGPKEQVFIAYPDVYVP
ncbi:uncharacterized protein OCT59_011875 [Rhizophagus irregularis]|uniref:Uncharacterized protein n=2 Tax=Rhizophagus irregularis TaxID=588596 RepID=A0A915ZJI4_9GLOM|nr:hypothetical protein RirG_103830 [Rhizophagus irregularis DAOM 197198w]UZO00756.1 hypothetical protein OCT59_011875 [Rhizophagus irregularis]CAB4489878.1 unnamed protein product [Rhizophagus irregularis]CAB5187619.1 unnamed protein product [Rhizophagus irregularis]CAB5377494.1 unnamed protein product [Rhizophagus irregularis]